MAYPDDETLSTKIIAAMNQSAAYWGNPASTPTDSQLALARDFANCGRITYQYVNISMLREGFTDATPYANISAKLAAIESELIKLFMF